MNKKPDLKRGDRYGLGLSENNQNRHRLYECLCICENIRFITKSNLVSGKTKSCGCMMQKLITAASERKRLEKKGVIRNGDQV